MLVAEALRRRASDAAGVAESCIGRTYVQTREPAHRNTMPGNGVWLSMELSPTGHCMPSLTSPLHDAARLVLPRRSPEPLWHNCIFRRLPCLVTLCFSPPSPSPRIPHP